MSQAFAGGYDVANKCALCGEEGDDERHRMYGCSKSEAAAAAAAPRWFLEEARRADPSDSFWTTGIFPHPSDLAPPPRADITVVWDNGPEEDNSENTTDGLAEQEHGFGDYIYVDGSCKPQEIRDMTRAGSSVVMVNAEGAVRRRGLVAVPDHLPQTSHVAEGLALTVGIRSLTRKAQMSGDCKSVVDALNAPCTQLLAARRKGGGLLMDTLRDPERRRMAGEIRWVKAHRHVKGDEDLDTKRDILGNNAADAAANEARELHPAPRAEAEAWATDYTKQAPCWLKCNSNPAALPAHPKEHASPPKDRQRQPSGGHCDAPVALCGGSLALRSVQ